MDTKIKCGYCDREMGLTEFSSYVGAYLLKLIIPAVVPFIVTAITHKLSNTPEATRGPIDETMSGLANNFSLTCPHCKQIDWYPASEKKPKKLKEKSEQAVS